MWILPMDLSKILKQEYTVPTDNHQAYAARVYGEFRAPVAGTYQVQNLLGSELRYMRVGDSVNATSAERVGNGAANVSEPNSSTEVKCRLKYRSGRVQVEPHLGMPRTIHNTHGNFTLVKSLQIRDHKRNTTHWEATYEEN